MRRVKLLLVGAAACASAARAQSPSATSAPPITAADVHFFTGMIAHHSQAVLMAGWAVSHGAGPGVAGLCARIEVGQRDEIVTMQNWLRDHGQSVPVPDTTRGAMNMPMDHMTMMPGMLTAAQLRQLDAARGTAFDSLFLTYMISHHQGALIMVNDLLGSEGAAQDGLEYKIATDISADQTVEIDRMRRMLAAMSPGGSSQ